MMRLNTLLDLVGISGREATARSARDVSSYHEVHMDRLGFLDAPLHLIPVRQNRIAEQSAGLRPRHAK
jgi:hypothetical protein